MLRSPAMIRRDCVETCHKYRYWWLGKSGAMARMSWEFDQCIRRCERIKRKNQARESNEKKQNDL